MPSSFIGGHNTYLGDLWLGGPMHIESLCDFNAGGGLVDIAHYTFDENGSGLKLSDNLSKFPGTYHGTPTFNQAGPSASAIAFPTSSDYAIADGAVNVTNGIGAIGVWFRLSAYPTGTNLGLLFGSYNSATQYDKVLYVDHNGYLYWTVNDGSIKSVQYRGVNSGGLTLNRWYFAVGVTTGTQAILYVNGVNQGSTSAGHTISSYTSGNLHIAGGTADTFVGQPGVYDEAWVTDQVPNADQVLQIFQQGQSVIVTNVRVSQVSAEVVRSGSAAARITQFVQEVVYDQQPNARISQFVLEVLRSSAVGGQHIVSASNSVSVTASASNARARALSASNSVLVDQLLTTGGRVLRLSAFNSVGAASGMPAIVGTWLTTSRNAVLVTPTVSVHDTVMRLAAANAVLVTNETVNYHPVFAAAANSVLVDQRNVGGRVLDASASNSVSVAAALRVPFGAHNVVTASVAASAHIGNPRASSSVSVASSAIASVCMPSGGGTPGGSGCGLSASLYDSVTGEYPVCFAETPDGLLLMSTGLDPLLRWDGLSPKADTAGVQFPTQQPTLTAVGVGLLFGTYSAYVRFVDNRGNLSNPTPAAPIIQAGQSGLVDAATLDTSGQVLTIESFGHGLTSGVQLFLLNLSGFTGINAASEGPHAITVTDADHFTVTLANAALGTYAGDGSWASGCDHFLYANVPTPTESKVVRRQLLRNTNGQMTTYYVDIDTTDLTSTSFTSKTPDADLLLAENQPVLDTDGTPLILRYFPPPDWKLAIAAHLGRVFAAAEIAYAAGHAECVYGSTTVKLVGAAPQANWKNRFLYVIGAQNSYQIASVNRASSTLTLLNPFNERVHPFAAYAIRPAPAERRLLYWSEAGLPEAWPPWNALQVQETSDEIVGLMTYDSFLYILERRHIHRFTFQTNPAVDGFVFQSAQRGVINNRCWVIAEGSAYLLDEAGIYSFDGDVTPISAPIQDLFQEQSTSPYKVNWAADQTFWHAAHDPIKDTIRWFVSMSGMNKPRHAICYNYRQQRWWIEEYPSVITSSRVGTIGHRRSFAGTSGRRVLALAEGTLDLVDGAGASRSVVSSTGPVSLTSANAGFAGNLAGSPVVIVSGLGEGQERIIVGSTDTTLIVDRPWEQQPAGATYQVGGVAWQWRSGLFRYAEDESSSPRDIEVVFLPTPNPGSMILRLYYDQLVEARTWMVNRNQDGLSTLVDSADITVDLTTAKGWVKYRMEGHTGAYEYGDRFVTVDLTGVQGDDSVRVFQIIVSGAEGDGA